VVWAIVPDYWQYRDQSIHQTEKPNPPNYIAEDFMVDFEQENGQPAKEKEQREMQ